MPSIDSRLAAPAAAASAFAPHWALYPRTYIAPRAPFFPLDTIDGDLTKDVWSAAPWSEDFDDIRGPDDAPPSERPSPTCRTRVKMMWDDTYLYIGALLTSDMTVVANFTETNSPIYQRDSDFEVFLDPPGSCHSYKEFEVNALNTVWNLMLNRPYNDGGVEYSGRIAKPGEDQYYDVYRQKSATRLISGKLNDPKEGASWSVEIAMAYDDVLSHLEQVPAPTVGSRWRINFSRVEKRGKINWTWQPQIVWNASEKRFSGYVNMHLPDAWGYIVFANDVESYSEYESIVRDPTWPARLAAMNVYYAQHQFKKENKGNTFASHMAELSEHLCQDIVKPFAIDIKHRCGIDNFLAEVKGNYDRSTVTVTDDRLIGVVKDESRSSIQ